MGNAATHIALLQHRIAHVTNNNMWLHLQSSLDGNFSTSLVLLCEERPAYLCPTNALVAYALVYLIHQYIIATYM